MVNLLENSRLSQHYFDQTQTNGLLGQQMQQQQQQQKQHQQQQQQQRLQMTNKFDQMGTHNLLTNNSTNSQPKRMQAPQPPPPSQHNPYIPIDDDLGFDPFIETQKALAEIIENENVQQQTQMNQVKLLEQNCQRTRMPPPGFNHMNAFGFGVPRAQGKFNLII